MSRILGRRRLRPELEARVSRRGSGVQTRFASQERMEPLIKAVREQDVEKVKVRRLLEAVYSTESGPSRVVCLGLGQWTLDAVVACVESSLASGTSQAIVMLHAGARPCRSGRQVP